MMKSKLHQDDEVIVIAGRDKGARGNVIRTMLNQGRVLVSKVNMVKRHTRQTQESSGGIVSKEAPLALSNVQFYCANCQSGVKIGSKQLDDGRKVRTCRKCGEVLDS
ncbi:MAG: 50S ribosomal protein L24 [Mariprofundales bacterium]|nr:50S ribosomal protein L24 [Mariprofundales bacterium]